MDLIVNAVVKAAMRKNRIHHILGYFNKYKDDVRASQRLLRNHQSPEFRPPAPCIIDGVKALFDCLNNQLRQESFQLSVHRVYQSVGLAPMHTANTGERIFALYPSTILSNLLPNPFENESNERLFDERDDFSLGGMMLAIESRQGAEDKEDFFLDEPVPEQPRIVIPLDEDEENGGDDSSDLFSEEGDEKTDAYQELFGSDSEN